MFVELLLKVLSVRF